MSTTPVSASVDIAWVEVVVTAANGGAGDVFVNSTNSSDVLVRNIGERPIEVNVDAGEWFVLESRHTKRFDISLALSTLRLRKSTGGLAGLARVEIESLSGAYTANEDAVGLGNFSDLEAQIASTTAAMNGRPSRGTSIMAPGSGVTPTVTPAGTGWSLTSSGFETVDGESWFKVVMTGTGGGIGQMDLTITGIRPFAADSVVVEYMADHSQGGPMTANISVDTNFSGAGSPNVVTNGRNMTAPSNSDPLMHSGRNAASWTKGGISVVAASFVISTAEPVIGKLWAGIRIRRAINNITGTVTFWLRSIHAGVNARKGRLAIVADDGYHSWFRLGAPILARYGLVSTAALIASGIGVNTAAATGNATLQEIQDYIADGNTCICHGPNNGDASLFEGTLAGGVEKTADRLADMVATRDALLAAGLVTPAGANCYAWPKGIYNTGNGGVELLDAAYGAGFRLGRGATVYPLLLPKVNALSARNHSRLVIQIIGHGYAGLANTADDATETTNINNIITYIQAVAAAGCDAVLMLHRVVKRGGALIAGPNGIEIETDRLAALCAAIQTLVVAGTLECVPFETLGNDA